MNRGLFGLPQKTKQAPSQFLRGQLWPQELGRFSRSPWDDYFDYNGRIDTNGDRHNGALGWTASSTIGTLVNEVRDGYILLRASTTTATVRHYYLAPPAEFMFAMYVRLDGNNNSDPSVGFTLKDSISGRLVLLTLRGAGSAGGAAVQYARWNTETSFNANTTSADVRAASAWLFLQRVGTTLNFLYHLGSRWWDQTPVLLRTEAESTFLTNPGNQLGICVAGGTSGLQIFTVGPFLHLQ